MLELLFGPSDVTMSIFGAIASGIGSIAGKIGLGGIVKKGIGLVGDIFGSPAGASAASLAGDRYMLEKKHQFSKREAQKTRDFQTGERVAQQAFSAQQAAKQMNFQERMASTQTQRATKDLEKAGLNRILALGQPAIAPQGAMASASQPSGATAHAASSGEGSAAVRNAIGLMSAKQHVDLQREQTKKVMAEARSAAAQADFMEMLRMPASMLMDYLGRESDTSKGLLQKVKEVMDIIGNAAPLSDSLTGGNKNVIEINRANHPNDRKPNWNSGGRR